MSQLGLVPIYRATDSNGNPLANARLYTFVTGTTTAAVVYTTPALSVSHGAYVQADSAGLFPAFYLDPTVTYRFQVRIGPSYSAAVSGLDFDPVTTTDASSLSYTPPGVGGSTSTVGAELNRVVFAEKYGVATGGTGTSNATDFGQAITALSGGGVVNIGPGTFTLDTTVLNSNVTIQGAGMEATIIEQGALTSDSYGILHANSGSPSAFVDNITIRDLTLRCSAGTFDEFAHLMSMNGVRNLLVERVRFQGFQGDGLFLGSGTTGGHERHNHNVVIRDCVFDGVNNQNRNAISVIDVDHITIRNCSFVNCTKTDDSMPGPIDFEPEANAFAVIRNVRVENNSFEDCGGSAIALLLPSIALTNPPESIIIRGNRIVDCDHACSVFRHATTDANTTALGLGFQFIENHVRGCTEDDYFILNGVFGAQIRRNTFESCGFIELGFDATNRNIFIEDNTFTRCGTAQYVFIQDMAVTDCFIRRNRFVDCGLQSGGPAGYIFYLRGASANATGLCIDENIAEEPNTKTTSMTLVVGGYGGTVDATSRFKGNRYTSGITSGTLAALMLGVYPDQLYGSATVNVASIGDGDADAVPITVTGAALGDFVLVSAATALEAGLSLSGVVTAADTVSARILNNSGGAVDRASDTYYARVFKR